MNTVPMMPSSNPNADWLNFRGTWATLVLIVVFLKILFSCVPGMSTELSWTLTNLTYNIVRARRLPPLSAPLVYVLLFPLALRHAL